MQVAVQQRKWGELSDLAHALKGTALGIGAKQLSQAARELERVMNEPGEPKIEDILDPVQTAFRAVRSQLLARTALSNDSSRLT
jgi:HPt (histidine-containing phosphotransfer) domain-containing protein